MLVIGSAPLASQTNDVDSLVVVTTEIAPFVERNGDRADGFYIEIWDDVADEMGVEFEVIWADSYPTMLAAVEAGEADVAVAPLAPTAEREQRLDFSSAVISSGPQLGVHERTRSDTSLVRTLLGSGALRVLLVALLGLVILGHLIWLVERRDQDMSDFHHSYPRGVIDGMWWAAVTVTTVGYGDMSPKSLKGRFVAMFAMLASLFLVGAFVSQVTADLSAARELSIASLDDADDRLLGVVAGSTFETYVRGQGFDVRAFDTQVEMFEAAEVGDIDLVMTNPYAIDVLGAGYSITSVGDVLYEEFETFGLQQGSPWREPINAALAELQVEGQVQRVIDRWTD